MWEIATINQFANCLYRLPEPNHHAIDCTTFAIENFVEFLNGELHPCGGLDKMFTGGIRIPGRFED